MALNEGELSRLLNEYERTGHVEMEMDGREASVKLIRVGSEVRANGTALITDLYMGKEAASVAFLELESPIFQSIVSGDINRLIQWIEGLSKVKELDLISKVAEDIARDLTFTYESAVSRFRERQKSYLELEKDLQEQIRSIDEEQSRLLSDPDFAAYEELARRQEERLAQIRENRNRLRGIRRNLITELSKIQTRYASLSAEIGDLKAKKTQLERSVERVKKEEEASKHRIESLERQYSEIQSKIREIERELNGYLEDSPHGRIKIPGIRDRMAEVSDILSRRKRELEQPKCEWCGLPIRGRVKCPNCGHEFSLAEFVEHEVEDLEEELRKLESLHKKLSSEKALYESEKRRIMAELSYLKEGLKKELSKYYTELTRTERDIKTKERELRVLEKKLDQLDNEIRSTDNELKELDEKEEAIMEELFKQIPQEKAVRLENVRKRINELERRRSALDEQLLTIRARIEQLADQEKELIQLEKKVKLAQSLADYFKRRTELVRIELVNEINRKLKEYFNLLQLAEFEDMRLDLSTRELILLRPNATTPTPLTALSDAEKGVLAVILSYVIKKVIVPDLPLFTIDTISELLDDTRVHRLLKKLHEEASKRNEIIIVSRLEPFTEGREAISQENITLLE